MLGNIHREYLVFELLLGRKLEWVQILQLSTLAKGVLEELLVSTT